MNIVYYLESFPKLSESFILNEIYELKQNGHNVAVCASDSPSEDIVHQEFAELDVPIRYFPEISLPDVTELTSSTILSPRVLKGTSYNINMKRKIINLLRAKQCIEFVNSLGWEPDHFHSHFASPPTFGAQHASDYYRVPCTVTTHASDLYDQPVGEYTSDLLQRANRIITISEYNREQIRSRCVTDTPIDIVRAGIRPEKFTPTDVTKQNRILTISRFVEKKGLTYAIEAVNLAIKEYPELEYHLIGSGELESDLVQKVERLGLDENISFLDNVSDQQLVSELNEARCFLLPCVIADSGDRDGIPVALMEAMAMKTPPVSTTVSGIPELVEHETNGLLTETRNAKATANALISLLSNNSQWTRYANRARQRIIDEFNINTEVKKLESIFQHSECAHNS